ncbi:hypothetical protein A2U01_0038544 [Trifolium medium]|uniref:Uncharacterized protein n=1 Tax=Trifolium medium TaxID=97028 RepID=A0A392Q0A0_9FABA|nr:hypothetical protein [Trifolium medium]
MEFLGGLELKPPQSTLFCVLSPGDVLEVARRHELAGSRQDSPVIAKLSVPSVANPRQAKLGERDWVRTCFGGRLRAINCYNMD